jgi:hypothetical protein
MSGPISKEQWTEARRLSIDAVLERIEKRRALLSYQQRTVSLLESTACQVLFIEKSRRIGLTWGFASYAVLRAARAREAGGMDVMYISYSQEMTREFIDACAMWASWRNSSSKTRTTTASVPSRPSASSSPPVSKSSACRRPRARFAASRASS